MYNSTIIATDFNAPLLAIDRIGKILKIRKDIEDMKTIHHFHPINAYETLQTTTEECTLFSNTFSIFTKVYAGP